MYSRRIIIVLIFASIQIAVSKGRERRTKYGCEGSILDIQCDEGTAIKMVRANFGRFSISICNDKGVTDWSVNCMQPRTLRVINGLCDGKPRCSVPVDSTQFGDPCPGTHKYVEVHYTCEPIHEAVEKPVGTPKSIPPWLLDLAATPAAMTSTTTTTTTTTMTTTTTVSTTTTTTTTPPTTTTTTMKRKAYTTTGKRPPADELSLHPDVQANEIINLDSLEILAQHCPPRTARNLFWNWTRSGEDAIQVCPQGTTGFARWSCTEDGEWSSESPNLGECQSLWISRLESRLQSGGAVTSISSELAASTETKFLYGGDTAIVSKLLARFAHRLQQELYVIPDQEEKVVMVDELLQNVLKTGSNLLSEIQAFSWMDLHRYKRAIVAPSLIMGLEENSLLLAETINNEKNSMEATNHILSSVRVMRARDATDQIFPGFVAGDTDVRDAQLRVPASALIENSINGAARLVFFLYDKMHALLPVSNPRQFVNSKVIGAAVSKGRNIDLENDPVEVTLRHLTSVDVAKPLCVSWEYATRSWTPQGCALVSSNSTHSVCKCYRLANYALLMEDFEGEEEAAENIILNTELASNSAKSPLSDDNMATLISCLVAMIIFVMAVLVGLILIRYFDLGISVDKFINNHHRPFCKKKVKRSTSFYPTALMTSSPTSTTVSSNSGGGGSDRPSATAHYLEHVLNNGGVGGGTMSKEQQQYCQQIQIQRAMPQVQRNQGSISTVMGGLNNQFRPVSPYGHIYMEIDPVYAHLQQESIITRSSEASDILQLSDISDDDLNNRKCSSEVSSSRQSSSCYAEERPLIKLPSTRSSSSNHFLTSQRPMIRYQSQLQDLLIRHHHTLKQQRDSPRTLLNNQILQPSQQNQHQIFPENLEAPITIALQGGDQFVSLQIDNSQGQQSGGLIFSDI